MLPDHVWVPLRLLRYEPDQWGGLEDFLRDVEQAWFEDGQHWFGVQFGGSTGWRKVAPSDCKTLDWHREPLQPATVGPARGSTPS